MACLALPYLVYNEQTVKSVRLSQESPRHENTFVSYWHASSISCSVRTFPTRACNLALTCDSLRRNSLGGIKVWTSSFLFVLHSRLLFRLAEVPLDQQSALSPIYSLGGVLELECRRCVVCSPWQSASRSLSRSSVASWGATSQSVYSREGGRAWAVRRCVVWVVGEAECERNVFVGRGTTQLGGE